MNRRVLLMGRSGCGKTSLIIRIHEKTGVEQSLSIANKTQAAEYHSDFIDVPGEYLEVRSFYRALIMLTCEACAIALLQSADDEESLYPTGLARTFDKPVVGVVTKTDIEGSDPERAEEILRDAGATHVFYTSALKNEGFNGLTQHLEGLR